MHTEIDCEGKLVLGSLPPETSKELTEFNGNWLEFSPEDNSIIVRHIQPTSCPAISAVPCELMAIVGSLPPSVRETMPGGAFYLKGRHGTVLRLVVERGEVRAQWPHPDFSHATADSTDKLFASINPSEARVSGWAKFQGGAKETKALETFIDNFEGLYEEGKVVSECKGTTVHVQFNSVNVGPKQLISRMRELAGSPDTVEAELDISSFAADSTASEFRVRITKGEMKALRPSLWK